MKGAQVFSAMILPGHFSAGVHSSPLQPDGGISPPSHSTLWRPWKSRIIVARPTWRIHQRRNQQGSKATYRRTKGRHHN
eukprot:5907687-Karenia_brevis.AAC.1